MKDAASKGARPREMPAETPRAAAVEARPVLACAAPLQIARRQLPGLFAGGCLLAMLPGVAAAEEAGAVTALSGEGRAERSGGTLALSVGTAVFVGDTIQTAQMARLAMLLGTDTRIYLGGPARLRIDKYVAKRGGVLVLGNGAMLFDRADGDGGGEVITPFGRLAVRGTRFFVGPSQGRFSVFVGRGAVDVSAGDRTVSLRPGEGTDFEAQGAAPTPPQAWSEARIREALASVT